MTFSLRAESKAAFLSRNNTHRGMTTDPVDFMQLQQEDEVQVDEGRGDSEEREGEYALREQVDSLKLQVSSVLPPSCG